MMVEEQLQKLIITDEFFLQLSGFVLNFKERDIDAETLVLAAHLILKLLKLAHFFKQLTIFATFEKSGCLASVEELQEYPNKDVYDAANETIKWYDDRPPETTTLNETDDQVSSELLQTEQ